MTSRVFWVPPGSMTSSRWTEKTLPLKTTFEESTFVFAPAWASRDLRPVDPVFGEEIFRAGGAFFTFDVFFFVAGIWLRYHPASKDV